MDPIKIKGWPNGVNNILPDEELERDVLRRAVNVDILDTGTVRRRAGYTEAVAGTNLHSLWSDDKQAFFVDSGVLKRLNDDYSLTTMREGVGDRRMNFEVVDNVVYFMNGAATGKIVDGVARAWGVELPTPPVAAATTGSLQAGRYQTVCTFINDRGEESGCGLASAVTLATQGGISITLPVATSSEVVSVCIYLTPLNGEKLYEIARVPKAQTTYNVTVEPVLGRVCNTQFMRPPIPGERLTHYKGVMYFAAGNILWHTRPLNFGLMSMASDYIVFDSPITMIKGVDKGVFVACDETWFLAGSGPGDFTKDEALPFGAASDSCSDLSDSNDVLWYSSRGLVRGSGDGSASLVQEPNVMPDSFAYGSTLYRESNGVRHFMASLRGQERVSELQRAELVRSQSSFSGMRPVDFMTAELIPVGGS